MMQRRTLLQAGLGAAAGLACPAVVRAEAATTLKFVPYADLALLDPAVSAFVTRNHVLMVYDTLFAMDEAGVAQPQMLAGATTEPDGLTWTLTLRDGLRFHDGTPVLARDAAASKGRSRRASVPLVSIENGVPDRASASMTPGINRYRPSARW